jgi:hypothetical protein
MNSPEELVTEPLLIAFDIPVDTTANDAAQILSERSGSSRYVHAIVEWPGAGMRVFLRLHAASTAAKYARAPAKTPLDKEAAAMQFIRDNREMTARELCAGLKALGYVRSVGWVSSKRAEVIRADRRVS